MNSRYTSGKEVPFPIDEAVSRAAEMQANEGFGMLTEIAEIATEVGVGLERMLAVL